MSDVPSQRDRKRLTLLPETTPWHNESVVQRNECALAVNSIAQSSLIGRPDEVEPVAVHLLSESPDNVVGDIRQELRLLHKVRQLERLELPALSAKVLIDKVEDVANVGLVVVHQLLETSEDCGRVSDGGLVGEGLLVDVEVGYVHGLQKLPDGLVLANRLVASGVKEDVQLRHRRYHLGTMPASGASRPLTAKAHPVKKMGWRLLSTQRWSKQHLLLPLC